MDNEKARKQQLEINHDLVKNVYAATWLSGGGCGSGGKVVNAICHGSNVSMGVGFITESVTLTRDPFAIRAEAISAERQRIAALLVQFSEPDFASRRDWELERRAKNALIERLIAWLDKGAPDPSVPKDC